MKNTLAAFWIVAAAALALATVATAQYRIPLTAGRMTVTGGRIVMAASGPDAFTRLLLHCDGTNNSVAFPDASASNHTVTAGGNARVSTAQYKFGTGSGYFDRNGDLLTVAASSDWVLGTNDFTIDFWARHESTTGYQVFLSADWSAHFTTNRQWIMYKHTDNAKLVVGYSTNGVAASENNLNYSFVTGTWFHVALSRGGSKMRAFINGSQVGADMNIGTAPIFGWPTQPIFIGADSGTASWMGGWIDEIRISRGVARWTNTFTPPTAPY